MDYIQKPKVTIIIPCYNREKYIQKTVNSVLNQTYENFEVICIDDGCTDNTRDILNIYSKKIKVIEHLGRLNKGQSASINLGIYNSDSKYISILDSDDLFAPSKIEEQVEYLEANPKIGYMYSNGYAIDENDNLLYPLFPNDYIASGDPETILLECPLGTPSGYLIRRNVFKKAGVFNEKLRSAQDHDIAIRISEISEIGYLNKIHWYKREHSDSLSSLQAERRWRSGFLILKNAGRRYPYSFSTKRRRLAVLNFRMGQCMLVKNKYYLAVLHFLISGLLDPMRAIKVIIKKENIGGYN
ncbi:hypothetical protein DSCW_03910 [Desulfosarcina widdelii]|uniref:Glycosyltransferase 2-like domain-containing protein n=1 Tax=Desulfosarcina widdelii TaxID=947919 RepID=A0A5K7Z3D0_9BACT|nr:glycosyltransferase [Desulfosarcina widdelii]BBO72974.1 hypothetical protein DSCW_03910 [Desulfosarcina widdelii]